MARQDRCVAEAGVRDAASRAASTHAEAWVWPPATLPWPPFRSDSLSSVPPPLPGSCSSARRLRETRRAAGRMWVGGPVGRDAPAGSFATGRATRRHRRECRRCRPRARPPALMGLPYIEAAGRAANHERRLLGAGLARGVSPERRPRTAIDTTLPTGATAQARDSGARARERGNVVSVTVLPTRERQRMMLARARKGRQGAGGEPDARTPERDRRWSCGSAGVSEEVGSAPSVPAG